MAQIVPIYNLGSKHGGGAHLIRKPTGDISEGGGNAQWANNNRAASAKQSINSPLSSASGAKVCGKQSGKREEGRRGGGGGGGGKGRGKGAERGGKGYPSQFRSEMTLQRAA